VGGRGVYKSGERVPEKPLAVSFVGDFDLVFLCFICEWVRAQNTHLGGITHDFELVFQNHE